MNRRISYIERKINIEKEVIRKMTKSINQYKRMQKSAFILICITVFAVDAVTFGFVINKINGNAILFLLAAAFTVMTGYLEGKCLKRLHMRFEKTFRTHFKDNLEAIETAEESIDFLRSQMVKK